MINKYIHPALEGTEHNACPLTIEAGEQADNWSALSLLDCTKDPSIATCEHAPFKVSRKLGTLHTAELQIAAWGLMLVGGAHFRRLPFGGPV